MKSKESKRGFVYGKAKRFLCRARDFYVKSMMDFDGRFGGSGGGFVSQVPTTTSLFGAKKIRNCDDDEVENIKEMYYRSSSSSSSSSSMKSSYGDCRMDRSYSVGVGRIGRIDEEEPCEFLEEEITMKSEILLFPRSRSCAVVNRSIPCQIR